MLIKGGKFFYANKSLKPLINRINAKNHSLKIVRPSKRTNQKMNYY